VQDHRMSEKTVICLPTYNEARNIVKITENILEILPRVSILVIDDNSPDGTGAIAEQMALKHPRISVLHRPRKEGLGKAYVSGFRAALKRPEVRWIGQMDADLSHPPDRLPEMLRAAEHADLVIGSRYVSGGGTENWNIIRKMISRFGSLYVRLWLRIPFHDLTGGFKIWRRELLEQILCCPISAHGYAFQVETTFLSAQHNARIVEIPILFTDRNVGKSKMTMSIVFEAFWRVPLMGWHRL